MKILLLSSYDVTSHRYWREGLVELYPQEEWEILTLPARFFSWRIRSNAYTWYFSKKETLERNYDLIIATSMVDLSTLRGFIPSLGNIKTIVYFHENQFFYPKSEMQHKSIDPLLVNLYSAITADKIVFNSKFNRTSFLKGVKALNKKLPDHTPKGVDEILNSKSEVFSVPLRQEIFNCNNHTKDLSQAKILWNHRWEYDKAPEKFYEYLCKLKKENSNFELYIVGQHFEQIPEIFQKIKNDFSDHIKQFGFLENKNQYFEVLNQTNIVISTAIHEFQGISVMEAVTLGNRPLLPNSLCYPEFYPSDYLYNDIDEMVSKTLRILDLPTPKINNNNTINSILDL